ncbi:hypothetical protein BV20DRAFT_820025 [Pilatotrama ljubarskyi]|nr:hypothetical protein BV20DRAFT_820025 [Pilatotrama ljubarskyi]
MLLPITQLQPHSCRQSAASSPLPRSLSSALANTPCSHLSSPTPSPTLRTSLPALSARTRCDARRRRRALGYLVSNLLPSRPSCPPTALAFTPASSVPRRISGSAVRSRLLTPAFSSPSVRVLDRGTNPPLSASQDHRAHSQIPMTLFSLSLGAAFSL